MKDLPEDESCSWDYSDIFSPCCLSLSQLSPEIWSWIVNIAISGNNWRVNEDKQTVFWTSLRLKRKLLSSYEDLLIIDSILVTDESTGKNTIYGEKILGLQSFYIFLISI